MSLSLRRWRTRVVVGSLGLAALLGVAAWWYVPVSGPDEPELAGSLARHTTHSGGRERTWSSYAPPTAAPNAPLLVVLHGSMQDGDAMRAATAYRFDELADRNGFVVVYPDGVDGNWNECRRGGDFTAKREGVDDVRLVRDIVDELNAAGSVVDPGRVYATGYSSGGQLALRLAWEAADLVAGVAPVAANVPTAENSRCTDQGGPVPALFIAGTDDPLNPYEGGEVALYGRFAGRGTVLSAPDGAASSPAATLPPRWRRLRSCPSGTTTAGPSPRAGPGAAPPRSSW